MSSLSNMRRLRLLVSSLLAGVALTALVSSCVFGGDDTPSDGSVVTTTTGSATTTTASTVPVVIDELSTFKSKDPFKQQNLPATTLAPGQTTTTSAGASTTSTTLAPGQTTTTHPSDVTTPIHSLKVLSIDEVNGVPVVTFEVDGVIYEDKREGDVVSTSWGQIEVLEIDAEAQTVTFLHGSETRTLGVGEEFLK